MIIGYVLLGLIAVLMFFGLLNTTVKAMRIDPWVALFFVIAFIVGGIIPMVSFGSEVVVGIGGFIVPFVLMIVLVVLSVIKGGGTNVVRLVASIASITAVTTAVLTWMPTDVTWVAILSRFVIGILAGAISYVICADRISSVTGAIGGVVWGNLAAAMIAYFFGNADAIVLGSGLVYDAIIIGMVFAVVLAMVANQMRVGHNSHARANAEFADENDTENWNKFDDHMN